MHNKAVRFSCRLFIFYAITLLLWHFFHLYYEALLLQVSLRLGHFVFDLPLGLPELNPNDKIYVKVADFTFFPNTRWYSVGTTTAVPLWLSVSAIRWKSRGRMIFLGMTILFIFQIPCVFLGVFGWLYQNYPVWLTDASLKINEAIIYRRSDAEVVLWLNHFSKAFLRHIVTIGIWAGLVFCCKKKQTGTFIDKLL